MELPAPSQVNSALPTNTPHWPSVLQFVFSGLAALGLWGVSLIMGLMVLAGRLNAGALPSSDLAILLVAAGLGFTGCLALPSAWYALRRLMGRPANTGRNWPAAWRPMFLIFLFPLVLALGTWVVRYTELAWLLLPPLHLLAVGIPVVWLLSIARRDLFDGSPQRLWGAFTAGLVLAPGVAIVLELLAILLLAGVVVGGMSGSETWQSELTFLLQRFQVQQPDPQELMTMLSPYLANPLVLYLGLTLFSLFVPLIEEAAKPLGLWLLAGRGLSASQGFGLGALCGAGFALYENLLLSSSGEEWTILVAARVGTGVVHILMSAVMGWALAQAWGSGRYLRLGLSYLCVVFVHGLWNGLTIISAYGGLLGEIGSPVPGWVSAVGSASIYSFSGLSVILLLVLIWANRQLRRAAPAAEPIL